MDKKKPNVYRGNDKETTENVDDHSVPIINRQIEKNIKKPYTPKNEKINNFKPIVIAIISAIVIGSFLGIIMLNMFVGIEKDLSADDHNISAISDDTNDNENTDQDNTSTVALEQMDAYVIQGGVFAEKVNVEEWSNTYTQAGFQTTIWERDNQYFLLIGIANTRKTAKELTAEFNEHGLDVFVKEWNTNAVEMKFTKREHKWYLLFREQWYEALKSVDKQEGILTKEWGNLLENNIPKTDRFSSLIDKIASFHEEMEEADERQAQNMLLSIWQQYEADMK